MFSRSGSINFSVSYFSDALNNAKFSFYSPIVMMILSHYLESWELSDPELIAETATSSVYSVQHEAETVVLKLLTPIGEKDEINSAVALKCFNGSGAVALLKHDSKAQLLEFADGSPLTVLTKTNEDEKASNIIAETLNKLHDSSSVTPQLQLTHLSDRFSSLFDKAEEDMKNGCHSIFSRGAEVANFLLNSPSDTHILHGDIHHGNILHSKKRGWLSIDPKGLVGERTYDAANALCNPWELPDLVQNENRLLKHANILAELTNMDIQRLLMFTFAHACLSASWLLEDEYDPAHALKVASIIEPHL